MQTSIQRYSILHATKDNFNLESERNKNICKFFNEYFKLFDCNMHLNVYVCTPAYINTGHSNFAQIENNRIFTINYNYILFEIIVYL